MQKQVILVAGMHRSGTSLVNRLLNLHGVHIPIDIEYKNEFNERGYWESFEVQALNNKILRLGDSSWFDLRKFSPVRQPREKIEEIEQEIGEFAKRLLAQEFQVFSIKDPRICRIIPWWRSAFESCGARVSAIIPYRHPLEVAASIGNRDGFSTKYCLSLWLRNVLDAEFATRLPYSARSPKSCSCRPCDHFQRSKIKLMISPLDRSNIGLFRFRSGTFRRLRWTGKHCH